MKMVQVLAIQGPACVFPLFFLFALWLHVFYFCEIDVNRTKRDKEAVNGTYFAFVLHSFPTSSGMHIAKYAFYGFNDIVSGGIDEDEDESDGRSLQPTAPRAKRPAEDEEEDSSDRRRGKTGANEESWEAFKSLLVKEKISDRDTWRRWTKHNKKVIAERGWPVEGIQHYWRCRKFPFTTFKALSGNQDPACAQVKKHKGSDWDISSRSAGAQRGGSGGCGAAGGGRCNGMADDWMVEGNEYVGRRVRRSVREEEKIKGAADGEIVGWLPAEKADYISDITHAPVALWHMLYDDEGGGSISGAGGRDRVLPRSRADGEAGGVASVGGGDVQVC
jgi:hypothetical protein